MLRPTSIIRFCGVFRLIQSDGFAIDIIVIFLSPFLTPKYARLIPYTNPYNTVVQPELLQEFCFNKSNCETNFFLHTLNILWLLLLNG